MNLRPPSDREIVELFHLEFVRVLGASTLKAHYAIKGGCNLRFYFGSVRYSEDIDFDVRVAAKGTLEKQVDQILDSPVLERLLRVQSISVADWSKPKQTETTQRWKATLQSRARAVELNTKIEFSRRSSEHAAVLDPVDKSLLDQYGLPRLNARHYPIAVALRQKIAALVNRTEVQARDIFDLDLLLGRASSEGFRDLKKQVEAAIQRTMEVTYDQFVAQVVAYLMPEHAPLYESKETWESMQLRVVDFLEAIGQ
jgi:predicted nucleotidyltransferase component of viral defense system